MRPVDVNHSNENAVWEKLYGKQTKKPAVFRFKVGDTVRTLEENQVLRKGYRPTFTDQLFRVVQRIGKTKPATYKLELADTKTPIIGTFYEPEMIRVAEGSEPVRTIKKFLKADNSTGELRHWVSWNDGSPNSWVSDKELVLPL